MVKARLADRSTLITLAFLSLVPATAHLMYSWMGFAPIDQGFTLAYSRRIIEGQIPHLDFIIIRPFLSPLIHTPFVLFGGEYTYWFSRLFVWFEFACISWAWVSIINHAFNNPLNNATKVLVALAGFAASINHFIFTAWHTVDGMFLASIGVWLLVTRRNTGNRFLGYLLVATAYLTKQSFLFVAPLTLLLLGDWRKIRHWLTIAFPGIAYCGYLLATGAFSEAFIQLTAQEEFVSVGIVSYLNYAVVLGVLAGSVSMYLLGGGAVPMLRNSQMPRYAGALTLIALPATLMTVGMSLGRLSTVSYGVFGMVAGVVGVILVAALYRASSQIARYREKAPVVLITLVLAWSASLSFGFNAPGLMLGPMFAVLVAFVYSSRESLRPRILQATLIVAGVAIVLSFIPSRAVYIYREQPYTQLTEPLGEVLPGGRLIYTNPNTYEFIADLNEAKSIALERNKEYAIIPQSPGYWVQAQQANPLLIDWPRPIELGDQRLVNRVIRDLKAERGEVVVLVQKVDAYKLAEEGDVALDDDRYEVVEYVRKNFEKTGETEYFELYE